MVILLKYQVFFIFETSLVNLNRSLIEAYGNKAVKINLNVAMETLQNDKFSSANLMKNIWKKCRQGYLILSYAREFPHSIFE